jgi:hypothetical protein
VWGILLLLVVGYIWLAQLGTGSGPSYPWASRVTALLYGMRCGSISKMCTGARKAARALSVNRRPKLTSIGGRDRALVRGL